MTPLTKTFLAFLAVATLVTGTVAVRSHRSPPPESSPARLTPEQRAEVVPPQPQPVATAQPKPAEVEIPPPPSDDEPDLEDGNGS